MERSTPEFGSLGPYRILRKLGAGAMGTVYLGEGDGCRVALKVIHPHLLERRGFFKRFQREGQAGRKVDHPNVVKTLDCDLLVVSGDPRCFLVMEFVEGRNLRELLHDLSVLPEAMVREIALQITAGLEAIHAAGIVHRDLKPENLLITTDQRVRIMDLGVAKVQGASTVLTQDGQFAGSLHYASPEQIREEGVSARSDLYSLGVLLYELVTGDNPFRARGAAGVVNAQLNTVPLRASERNPDVSLFFSELLARLLAKDPAERFPSARAVHDVIEEGEQSEWWLERQQALKLRRGALPRIPVHRETKIYGRDPELDVLRKAAAAAKRGEGSTLLLIGEAGIGKTRLVDALMAGIADEELHMLYGSYSPAGGQGGISAGVLGLFGDEKLETALERHLTVGPALVPAFAALLKHEQVPEGGVRMEGDTIHAMFCHLLRGLAREKPVIWVVDDLHFAPQESRRIIQSLARAAAGQRVLLLVTARPELPEEDVARLTSVPEVTKLLLDRLSPREVVELLREGLHSEALADKLGAKIAYKSDGVPFFVFEMIRGLKEGQFITELPDGTYVESKVIDEIQVPSVVKDLIDARLGDLTADERAILDVGATEGFDFDPDLVAMVLEMPRLSVLRGLAEIARQHGVVRPEGLRYQFDHHQIQEVVYRELPQGLAEEYHSLLAEALIRREGLEGRDPGEMPPETLYRIAFHHLHGSRPEAGLPLVGPALDHLEEGFRVDASLDLVNRVLEREGLVEGTERVRLLLQKSILLRHLGRHEEALTVSGEALALAEELNDAELRVQAGTSLGGQLMQLSEYEPALDHLNRALALVRETGDRVGEGAVLGAIGNVFADMGRYEEAREHYVRHLDLARTDGDKAGEARALGNLALIHFEQGRRGQCIRDLETAGRIFTELGDQQNAGRVGNVLGLALREEGRYTEAREQFQRYHDFCREIGFLRGEAMAHGNLALVCETQGAYGDALHHIERDLEILRGIGSPRDEVTALNISGMIHGALGASERARQDYEAAALLSESTGFLFGHSSALSGLGEARLEGGDLPAAREFLGRALVNLKEIGADHEIAGCLLGLGRVHLLLGERDEAVRHFEEALALAEEHDLARTLVLACAELAGLGLREVDEARQRFLSNEGRLTEATKVEVLLILWKQGGNREDLDQAHGLVTGIVKRAPKRYRESLVENVPPRREVVAAWLSKPGES